MDHYRFDIRPYWRRTMSLNNFKLAQLSDFVIIFLRTSQQLCRTIMSKTSNTITVAFSRLFELLHYSLLFLSTFPFNKSLLFVIENEWNIYRNIILYGGSLGSLFDEERSKVRESNANCRTHWAWITRTHLAAKAQPRLNLLQSCLQHIKFIW